MTLAKSEAKTAHQKISDKAYNDEELIRILTTRSKAQLNATCNQYNNQFGNAITKVLCQPLGFAFSNCLINYCNLWS